MKRYGDNLVLNRTDFSVEPGVTGLLGANGAGKTTLIGMVLGLHRPDAGELRVFGLDPAQPGGHEFGECGLADADVAGDGHEIGWRHDALVQYWDVAVCCHPHCRGGNRRRQAGDAICIHV